jgi:SAM-dependent methyltransferase
MQVVWDRVGNLRGRTALLLGNGESQAELYFLTKEPRALIYTDLSAVGLAKLRRALRFPADNVVFTAMDALDLPLRDKSVDLVYGFAFAHHLPDLDRFIGEVERVLRPGGRCVMMDNAYAPIWQRLKLVWLRPLMWLSHRREPRSPEDLHDTMAGGFREERLAEVIERAGCDPWAERVAFLYYLWKRASVSLFPGAFRVIPRHDRVAQACLHTDRLLARFAWGRRNMIRLVWGFDKPGNMHARLSRSQH